MLIFHEGLPGSGKSFAAMVDHIGPALKKGRKVYAYVEGLNYEKISEALELPLGKVQELLHQIQREHVPTIYERVENDALVVIDELQNFWPSGRQKLSPEITQFVTEHRHRGLDVLCMGQALADCHTLWRRRIENRIVFSKLAALGADKRYSWTMFKQTRPDNWEKTTSGTGQYNPAFFGTYASHTDGTENTEHYKDKRAVIWNSPVFKYVLPVFLVVAALALWFVVKVFSSSDLGLSKSEIRPGSKSAAVEPVRISETVYKVENGKETVVSHTDSGHPTSSPPVQARQIMTLSAHVVALMENHRVRLGAVVLSAKPRVVIEWRDTSNRIVETLEAADLGMMGWHVMLNPAGTLAILTDGQAQYVVTPWPIAELSGKVSDAKIDQIKGGA